MRKLLPSEGKRGIIVTRVEERILQAPPRKGCIRMATEKMKKVKIPKTKVKKVAISLFLTLIVAAVEYYFALPALNIHSEEFYFYLLSLCLVYILCSLVGSIGVHKGEETVGKKDKFKAYIDFVLKQCMCVGIFAIIMMAVITIGELASFPMFHAEEYHNLLEIEVGDFSTDITQISYDKIPTLDRDAAEYLSDRQMGTLSDMVSQFEYSDDSTQINYRGRPVRVAPIDYADIFKWFANREEGLPAYVIVDMVTQEATVTRLSEGMKYSFSEPFNRNITRHLRFHYPTYMFAEPEFEIDESGHPYWIAPRIAKTIGLFGGKDIIGAVLVDAVTGECTYLDVSEVPSWVDNLFDPDLMMEQYDCYGAYANGFWNSMFGQKDVTLTTVGYNYIALNDDVYMYTGVTSANADQSNLGFLLCNLRTKETKYYTAPGATEWAARESAEGVVQDLGYTATFPILLNVSGEPTYFIPMKDAASLVKTYAMVNVSRYDIVATGTTVSECERAYVRMLTGKGITTSEDSDGVSDSGILAEIRSAVLDGNTYYYLRLEGSEVFYSLSAAQSPITVILNVGDSVTIEHAAGTGETGILNGYSVKRN